MELNGIIWNGIVTGMRVRGSTTSSSVLLDVFFLIESVELLRYIYLFTNQTANWLLFSRGLAAALYNQLAKIIVLL